MEHNLKTVEDISTKLGTLVKPVSLDVPFAINNTQLKMVFLLSWKQVFRQFLYFPEHNSKSIQDVATKLLTHIKQAALMCFSL